MISKKKKRILITEGIVEFNSQHCFYSIGQVDIIHTKYTKVLEQLAKALYVKAKLIIEIKGNEKPKHTTKPIPKTVRRYLDCKHHHKNVDPPEIHTSASHCNLYLYKDDCKNCQDFKGKE